MTSPGASSTVWEILTLTEFSALTVVAFTLAAILFNRIRRV